MSGTESQSRTLLLVSAGAVLGGAIAFGAAFGLAHAYSKRLDALEEQKKGRCVHETPIVVYAFGPTVPACRLQCRGTADAASIGTCSYDCAQTRTTAGAALPGECAWRATEQPHRELETNTACLLWQA